MRKIFLVFFLTTLNNDYLLQAIYTDWSIKEKNTDIDIKSSEPLGDAEPEHYSWDLGTPDNLPETVIIHSNPCESTFPL